MTMKSYASIVESKWKIPHFQLVSRRNVRKNRVKLFLY